MAVKDDVDICLNITGNVDDSNKQASKIFNDTRIKRLQKKASEKTKKTFQKTHSNESPNNFSLGAKKRVKQKSLATIVAKNLERAKSKESAGKPLVSILKKTSFSDPSTLSGTVSKENKSLVDGKKQNEFSNPVVSFSKLTKDNEGKVILARKRKIDPGDTKKSLSSIFKSTDSSETKLLKDNDATVSQVDNSFGSRKQNLQLHKRKLETNNTFQDRENKSKKIKSFNQKFDKNKSDNESKKNTNQSRHSGGKISSLFGNNPEIPNIGQRLVKPVDEKVFTAEKFSDLNVHAFSVSNLEQNMNITTMTTVQKKAIPVILTGQDVLIRSQTGSGKTLAYALPIIETLHSIRPKLARNCGTKALVIVPTRELALQSYECFLKLIKPFTWIVPGYLVGGEKRKAEKARLRKGCTILVTTPGRLLDHIRHTKALRLDTIKYFVLDEADRMLDMGYEKDISEIVADLKNSQSESNGSGYNALQMLRQHNMKSKDNSDVNNADDDDDSEEEKSIKKDESNDDENETKLENSELTENSKEKNSDESSTQKRQTILLSATLTHAVEKLAGLTMHDPVVVDAAKDNIEAAEGNLSEINEDFVVPQGVTQSYIVTPPKLRMVTLSAYIAAKCQIHGNHKTLVFMATQDMVDYHIDILSSVLTKPQDEDDDESDPLVDVEFFKLHGNMSQKERTEVFKTFRQTNSGVLLCTDVAARGLDLPKVDSVVQYTGPTSLRDYVHRIGRTARAGSLGTAVIFLTPPEVEFVRLLEARRIRIKQDDMDAVLGKLVGPLSRHNSIQATATALQNEFEELVLENKKYYAMACKAYTSWIRFYSSYPREMREVFNRTTLHLGHYAKSFALRDPPQKIGTSRKVMREKEEAEQSKPKHQNRLSNQRSDGIHSKWQSAAGKGSMHQQDRRSNMYKQSKMLNTSENDSGLEPIKKSKKLKIS